MKNNKINVKQTRIIRPSEISKLELLENTTSHIEDVQNGMKFIADKIIESSKLHDYTKMTKFNSFYENFTHNFRHTDWWAYHKNTERHHLSTIDGIPEDVNLIDVIEYMIDGIVSGIARKGKYYKEDVSSELLKTAFDNTVDLVLDNINVIESKSETNKLSIDDLKKLNANYNKE